MRQTTNEILTVLGLYPSQQNKKYAGKLSAMFTLVNELQKMDCFAVKLDGIKGNLDMVKSLPELIYPENYSERNYYFEQKRQQDNCKEIFGEFMQWDKIIVSHKNGSYSFPFPIGNKYYNAFLGMAGCEVVNEVKEIKPIESITIDSRIFKTMDKAAKFISKDDLRPAMTCVCLSMQNYKAQVVGTDAHQMYYSQKFECSQDSKLNILIDEKSAKKLSKIKFTNDIAEIHIMPDNVVIIEGITINTLDARYPDYSVVIPDYTNYMEFNKERFAANVKKLIPYSNKATCQINFHLNGYIALHSQDVDFSFECDADMPYISKSFKDTDIAFNGKFLLNVLSVFKDDNVKLYSEGKNTCAGIFSNDTDNVLLMPLMLNN